MNLDLGNLLVHIKADNLGFKRSLSQAERTMESFGRKLTSLGIKASLAITAPLTLMARQAFKTAVSIEDAFAGVRKTIDATEDQFVQLKTSLDELSRRVPVTIEGIYGIAEAAGQLGIEKENIIKFTEVIAGLGSATNMSSQEAATSLAQLANVMQMNQKDFERLGSTIVELGNNSATFESNIVNMALRMAGVGRIVGMTESDVLSFSAALSSVGMEAEAGGTAMSKMFLDMNNSVKSGNEDLSLFAKVAGKSREEFQQLFGTSSANAMIAFIEGLGRLHTEGVNVGVILEKLGMDNVRVTRALLGAASAGDLFRRQLALGSKAWKENSALAEETRKRYETTASKIVMYGNWIRQSVEDIGNILRERFVSIADKYLAPVLALFDNLSLAAKEQIILYGAIAASLGPIALAFAGVNMVALTTLRIFAGMAVALLSWQGAALLVVAMGYTLYAAWNQNLSAVKDRMQDMINAFTNGLEFFINSPLGQGLTAMVQAFGSAFKSIREGWKNELAAMASSFVGTWVGLKEVYATIKDAWSAPDIGSMMNRLKAGFKGANQASEKAWQNTFDSLVPKVDAFANYTVTTLKLVPLALKAFGEAEVEHLSDLLSAVKKQFGEDFDGIVASLKQHIPSMSDAIDEAAKNINVASQGTKDWENALQSLGDTGAGLSISGLSSDPESLTNDFMKSDDTWSAGFKRFARESSLAFQTAGEKAYEFAQSMESGIASGLENVLRNMDNWKQGVLDIFEEIYYAAIRIAFIQPAATGLATAFSTGVSTLLGGGTTTTASTNYSAGAGGMSGGGLPGMADGGIAWSPTVTRIAEKGPELVTPLSELGSMGGSTTVNVINQTGQQVTVSKKEEYMLSDQRIIDVTLRAAGSNGNYRKSHGMR